MPPLAIHDLNDDCLSNIVLNLVESSSFYNFVLTCKRFQRIASKYGNLHEELLAKKADFYAKKFIVFNCCYEKDDGYEEYCNLQELLEITTKCSASVDDLLDEERKICKQFGPVTAKLFSWLKNVNEEIFMEAPRSTSERITRILVLHLPKCDRELTINTDSYINLCGDDGSSEVTIQIICGDVCVECCVAVKLLAESFRDLSEDEIRKITTPLRPAIDIIQAELGSTTFAIAGRFFVWFCNFFLSKTVVELKDEEKLSFLNDEKNQKPTFLEAQQTFAMTHSLDNIDQAVEKWRNEGLEFIYPEILINTLKELVYRKSKKTVEKLKDDISIFYSILTTYDFRTFPKEMMMDLFVRTRTLTNYVSVTTDMSRKVQSSVVIFLKGGKSMTANAVLRDNCGDVQLMLNFDTNDHVVEIVQSASFIDGLPSWRISLQ